MKHFHEVAVLLLLLVLLSAVSCRHDDDLHLVFIGGSCIERWDVSRSFPSYITTNYGKSSSGIEHVEKYAGKLKGQTVVILTGYNDLGRLLQDAHTYSDPESHFAPYVNRYVEAVNSLSADRILLLTILPQGNEMNDYALRYNQYISILNNMLSVAAEQNGWQWVDVYTDLLKDGVLNPAYSYDGLHPNDIGYEILTRRLNEHL